MEDETNTTNEGNVEEGQVATGSTEESEAAKATAEAAAAAASPSETEQKIQEQFNDLQGKFDTLSQDSARREQYLEQITPYVDFDGLKGSRQEEGSSEEDQSFLTKAEAKALEQKIETKIATADFTRDFRTKYPDLGDKGPKEEMVRFFFENKTLRTDSFDKRLESAVKATRGLLKTEVDTVLKDKKAEEERAALEAKKKEEAAAKASGISSGTITSPQKTEKESETTSDYIADRREKQEKLKS